MFANKYSISKADRQGILAGKYVDILAYKLQVGFWIYIKPSKETIQAVKITGITEKLVELKDSGITHLVYILNFRDGSQAKYYGDDYVAKVSPSYVKYVHNF